MTPQGSPRSPYRKAHTSLCRSKRIRHFAIDPGFWLFGGFPVRCSREEIACSVFREFAAKKLFYPGFRPVRFINPNLFSGKLPLPRSAGGDRFARTASSTTHSFHPRKTFAEAARPRISGLFADWGGLWSAASRLPSSFGRVSRSVSVAPNKFPKVGGGRPPSIVRIACDPFRGGSLARR